MISLETAIPYAVHMPNQAPEAVDDATLARRISDCHPGRDAAAEAEICRRFGPRIRLYGLKHLRDEAAAADLRQDVLVLVLEKLRKGAVREPDRIASFVLGTARQLAIDGRRNAMRHTRILEAYPIDLMPADEGDLQEPLDTQQLRACLAALPERERAVLVMTFYDERPADTVASELGLSAGNVRVIRHRGLERLRGCMSTARGTA